MAKRLTIEEVLTKIEERNPGKFKVIEDLSNYEYKNVHQKIKIKCNKCGTEYLKRINDLLHGYGCNNCANLKRYSVEEMKERVNNLDSDYELLSNSCRTRDIGEFKHLKCGNTFQMKIHNFVTVGERCPFCNQSLGNSNSKGITIIKEYLDNRNINYEQEKKFENCIYNNRHLPFDIYLTELNILIEFDGIQHFKPIDIFGGEERFKRCKENDNYKNEFAKNNNIKLIRISYLDIDKIEDILKENGIN